jgi:predicted transcriptional regulator
MEENLTIAALIEPVDPTQFVRVDTETGQAFSELTGTKDSRVVLDQKGRYKGIISPSKALFGHHFPYTTKARAVLIRPPYLHPDSSLSEVAKAMLEFRVYTLPVFDENKQVTHVIRVRSMLTAIMEDKDLRTAVCQVLEPRAPAIASVDGNIKDIYKQMRDKRVSRVILVNESGKLAGITSRTDLKDLYTQPTPKQRYRSKGGHPRTYNLDSNPDRREDAPIRNFYTEHVLYSYEKETSEEYLDKLFASQKNSLVIVDTNMKPIAIVSTRDILEAIIKLEPAHQIHIEMEKSDDIDDREEQKMYQFVEKFAQKLDERSPIMKVQLTSKISKSPVKHIRASEVKLIFTLYDGKQYIATTSDRIQFRALRSAVDLIDKQFNKQNENT